MVEVKENGSVGARILAIVLIFYLWRIQSRFR